MILRGNPEEFVTSFFHPQAPNTIADELFCIGTTGSVFSSVSDFGRV